MAWPQLGFIDIESFLKHSGILAATGTSEYGETTIVSSSTVACYVYTEAENSTNSTPATTDRIRHFALIPSSVTCGVDYHLSSVTDPNGSTVISNARVTLVQDFNSHRYGARIKLLYLEIPSN